MVYQKLLSKQGYFYLKNHGVPKATIDKAMHHSKQFFQRRKPTNIGPVFASRDYREMAPSKSMLGYTPPRMEALNPRAGPDLKESFDYGLPIEGTETERAQMGLNKWPQEGPAKNSLAEIGFKDVAMDYLTSTYTVACELLHAICLGLGLEEKAFDKYFEKPLVVNRYISYPPRHGISSPQPVYRGGPYQLGEANHGAGSHVDFGAITMIYQEGEGLDVLDDLNRWHTVKVRGGTFVVNCGYMLQKITNDAVRAAKHRVINNASTNRYSFALFLDPSPLIEISPHPAFVDVHHPAKYDACFSGKKGVIFRQTLKGAGY